MLLLVAIPWVFGASSVVAKSELETLRNLCAEQERQIRQLEDENTKLRSLTSLSGPRGGDKTSLAATPPAPPAPPATPATPAKTSKAYTVRPNDNLERISRKLGITPAALAAMNGLKVTSSLREGQKLKVPGPAAVTAAPAAPTEASAPAQPAGAAVAPGKTHQVKEGETFSSIGRKYGIATAALVAANADLKPSALRPGQVIQLTKPAPLPAPEKVLAPEQAAPDAKPAARGAAIATPAATAAATPAAAPPAPRAAVSAKPAASGSTPAAKPNIRSVTIDGTTTYGEFAAKHGTTINRLNELNALELVETTVLAKGSELYIPAQP